MKLNLQGGVSSGGVSLNFGVNASKHQLEVEVGAQ
jgi:hypothetical protein